MGLSYPIFRLPNYPQRTGTRPGTRLGPHTATSRADGAASSGAPDRADRCPPRSSAGYRAPGRAAAASPGWGSRRYYRNMEHVRYSDNNAWNPSFIVATCVRDYCGPQPGVVRSRRGTWRGVFTLWGSDAPTRASPLLSKRLSVWTRVDTFALAPRRPPLALPSAVRGAARCTHGFCRVAS